MMSRKDLQTFLDVLAFDMIVHILQFLPPESLKTTRKVCKSFRDIINTPYVWRHKCRSFIPEEDLEHIILINNSENSENNSSYWEAFVDDIVASKEVSVIEQALKASSQDRSEEDISCTLSRDNVKMGFNFQTPSYWSSTGREERTHPEFLIYKLKSDVSLFFFQFI